MTRFFTTLPKPKLRTKLRAFGVWLAILTMLAQAFVPVGSALASTSDDGATQILVCTANGIQAISLDADGAPIEHKTQGSCPFCILHVAAIPSEQSFETFKVLFTAEATTVIWSPVNQNPATIWRATPGPSRAPPSFS